MPSGRLPFNIYIKAFGLGSLASGEIDGVCFVHLKVFVFVGKVNIHVSVTLVGTGTAFGEGEGVGVIV